ncbi:unnamed protein product [Thlaspi arvense]|uniref:FAS1 domain-containing protein n=1 Tax=Thlaspi arvense TaxID=13288 RepID=A0AAU9RZN1_THLAR|nr:unnamed protein product [Thlaspi arvense]
MISPPSTTSSLKPNSLLPSTTFQTITVLALSNDAISSLSGQPNTMIKKILSLHIVLDYYDIKKLKNLNKKSAMLTTLFQSNGQAKGQQGFLNATVMKNGDVAFGSAVPGSTLNAQLVDSVASQPFNISVLHISSAIMIDVRADAPTGSSSPVSSSLIMMDHHPLLLVLLMQLLKIPAQGLILSLTWLLRW